MLLKLRPLFYTLIFAASLKFIAFRPQYVLYASGLLLLISLFEGKSVGKKWAFSILPVFFTISSVALLYLIGLVYEQQIYIFLASSMYYLSLFGAYRMGEYEKDKTARGMNMAASTATIFFTFSSFYGLYLNFLVPLWSLMLAYAFVTLLVSFQHFYLISKKKKKIAWLYSFILALIMAEIIWTMNFWPFGYLTTGVIALILYYVLWDVVQSFFSGILNRRKIVTNAIFFSILIVLILLSSKWIPVI